MEQQRQREILKVIRKKMIPYKGVRIRMASDFSGNNGYKKTNTFKTMRDNSFNLEFLQPNYSLPSNDQLSTYKQSKIKLTISNQ